MLVAHCITHFFPPAHGGLGTWMLKLSHMLSSLRAHPITYVCQPDVGQNYEEYAKAQGVEVRLVGHNRSLWAEPLVEASPDHMIRSLWHLDFLMLKNAIQREINRMAGASHLIISAYAVREGFLGSIIAQELSLPHMALIVGSDFSRGFRNPPERTLVAEVAARSQAVVTFNSEQEKGLHEAGCRLTRTIHTSVDERVFNYRWKGRSGPVVRLFSDSGYSFKKGTQALLKAFAELHAEGLPISLKICGDYFPGEEDYWKKKRNEYANNFGNAVELGLYQKPPGLWEEMARYDIYCAPTIGEGCSHARMAALCIGMPIVTTRCGEIPDVAADVGHVRLAEPADFDGYRQELRKAVLDLKENRLPVDAAAVKNWRAHFAPERERRDWAELLLEMGLISEECPADLHDRVRL